jgi:histidine triad (HIT) family protein
MHWLARLGRTRPGRWLIDRMFAEMSFALPVHHLRQTDTLLAFYHPRPSYPLHILLVPRQPVSGLADLDPADTQFLSDLFATVQSLVLEFNLPATGYRLIVNGGTYQDFPHLHFHLIADQLPPNP